jgi:hypothetical protein
LSGLSEWVLAERHRRLWQAAREASVSTPMEVDAENATV